MLIIGVGRRTIKNYGSLKTDYCNRCSNNSDFQLHKHTKWISLFFIPLIPYGRDNLIVCPRCGYYEKIDEITFTKLKTALENKDLITQIPLKQEVDPYKGKNETQVNFLREMAKHKEESLKKNTSNDENL
ncbi:MAG: zinc ribbon domain-containing protein [Anaeromicrobium sp.]|jgi:hypothetical protein|uniref:zinc ribbon domain-containing protein n=1 Tax=Anaeromicrobium sp. TaxID=1929132 RepID=UPI0025D8A69E|nr:zinc ribbon domain-containing protein [Anaeromicrobium sp.]MCT4595195.1 zinc ribbon domain-containing protein [Anaeromicrobium sp.]